MPYKEAERVLRASPFGLKIYSRIKKVKVGVLSQAESRSDRERFEEPPSQVVIATCQWLTNELGPEVGLLAMWFGRHL
jgi:hypothetical protein